MHRLARTAAAAVVVGVVADLALVAAEGRSARHHPVADHVGSMVAFGVLSVPCIAIYQGVEWLTRPR